MLDIFYLLLELTKTAEFLVTARTMVCWRGQRWEAEHRQIYEVKT